MRDCSLGASDFRGSYLPLKRLALDAVRALLPLAETHAQLVQLQRSLNRVLEGRGTYELLDAQDFSNLLAQVQSVESYYGAQLGDLLERGLLHAGDAQLARSQSVSTAVLGQSLGTLDALLEKLFAKSDAALLASFQLAAELQNSVASALLLTRYANDDALVFQGTEFTQVAQKATYSQYLNYLQGVLPGSTRRALAAANGSALNQSDVYQVIYRTYADNFYSLENGFVIFNT